MNNVWRLSVVLILFLSRIGMAQEIELANEYFQKGEYEKAKEMYQHIARDNVQATIIHENYLATLVRLKDFDQAEKFIKKQIKQNPDNILYKADHAYLEAQNGKEEESEVEIKKVIDEAIDVETNVYILQNYFYNKNDYKRLVELFEKAKDKSKDKNKFTIQLARAYLYNGNKEKMLDEIIAYGLFSNNDQYVQATIQDNIKEEAEIEMLERKLYTSIQENPNEIYYTKLLIWHFIQQKDFRKAFTQARALDRRLRLEGQGIFEIAAVAFENKDYKNAAMMYEYIMKEYPRGEFYPYAKRWYIQTKEEIVKTTYPVKKEDIESLIAEYESLFSEIGRGNTTLEALRNVAMLEGFYLGNHDKAIELLQEVISLAGTNQNLKDQCKLDMGDIYVLKNEPWESTLLYLQVEKSKKEDKLGELAKLKNAKNYYYKGEFELAKDILDILKKATTREIANDAMELSLLIQDNTGLDTSETPMQRYAAVELQLFQNKNAEALDSLNKMYEEYKTHYLADEILWQKANLLYKLNDVDNSIEALNKILENYPEDILADNAMFLKAKLIEEQKGDKKEAMALYRGLLQKYPGSIFCAEARKRYRILRGDYLN